MILFIEFFIWREIKCYDKIEMNIMVSQPSSLTTGSITKTSSILYVNLNQANFIIFIRLPYRTPQESRD